MLERLRVAEIVDDVVGPRRADAAASVGTYIALAVGEPGRRPVLQARLCRWWATTAGDRLVTLPAAALDHRRFWDAMDQISEDQLAEIERRIVAAHGRGVLDRPVGPGARHDELRHLHRLGQRPGPDRPAGPRQAEAHAICASSGWAWWSRSTAASRSSPTPMPGDRPDVTQFPELVDELVARFAALAADAGDADLGLRRRPELGGQLRARSRTPRCISSGRCRPLTTPTCSPWPAAATGPSTPSASPDFSAFETAKRRLRRRAPHRGHPLAEPARQAGPGLRPDPRPRPAGSSPSSPPAWDGARPASPRTKVEAEIAAILKPRWLSRVISTTLIGDEPAELRLDLADQAQGPCRPRRRAVRQAHPVHRQGRPGLHRRDRRRLPLPVRRRGRLPPDERPQRRVVLAHVPLDRPQDPGPRLALRARPHVRPPHGPRSRPRRHHMSVRELLATLAGIQETVLLYQGERGRPRARRMLTEMTRPTTPLRPLRPRRLRPDPLS